MSESNPKVLPFSFESEQGVIGSILNKNDVIDKTNQHIKPKDFYDSRNRMIYQTCLKMYEKNIKIDINTLQGYLRDENILEDVGGEEYLESILLSSFYTSNVDQYAKRIKEKSTLRELIYSCQEIMEQAYNQKDDVEYIIENAESSIFDVTQQSLNKGLVRVSESLQETLEKLNELTQNEGKITGVTTGISSMDYSLSGLQKSQLIVLAARPAMGKTALGVTLAWNAAKAGKKVAFFSLEMSSYQLSQRLLSMVSFVELENIIGGKIEDEQWQLILQAAREIAGCDLYIDETAAISLSELRSKAKRLKAENGLDLIVIDYLQLMTVNDRSENRQQEISKISRGLKALSKELDCPVLSLAQLSREADKRSDHKPILSDLRESGAIEQDADVVMLLYREDYYDPEVKPNIADLIIAKHRNGSPGSLELYFNKKYTMFTAYQKEFYE